MNRKEAEQAGKVTNSNTKMPGTVYSMAANWSPETGEIFCKTGHKLAQIDGSVCRSCYAYRLMRFRPNVNKAWQRNLTVSVAAIDADAELWQQSIAWQIHKSGEEYHRWFDSGDLQSIGMLAAIVEVCLLTPKVKHWLPTRETGMVIAYCKAGPLPKNLTIRVSSPMVDQRPIKGLPSGVKTSTVHKTRKSMPGNHCPAQGQGNQCLECRACWQRGVNNVSYPLH